MNDIITITHGKERVVPSFPVGRYYTKTESGAKFNPVIIPQVNEVKKENVEEKEKE